MKALLIDNFDSFVYNLYQMLAEFGLDVDVVRNNALSLGRIKERNYRLIIISPGPGNPKNKSDFGVCAEVISKLGRSIPVLGVCLGHQGIVSAFGGKVVRARKPMHGKTSLITHSGKGIFRGIRNNIRVMRYHSLVADEESFPDCLAITARSRDDRAIMGLQHKSYPIFGVQFHPESIMTEHGREILYNFCRIGLNERP
ncbi:aminodeoxychorismate/anthranilate synthase component II [Candidatus Woesearchaeota archaeon]|nr:aminodeoxychorismate/anthranilate synthase component II [Candidatus Woesearchaeota archaeon]